LKHENKGVSPVVGTILLIAVTVALAAVVATLVGGLGGGAVPPSATLNVTAKFNSDDNTVTLTITHQGGDSLVVSDLRLIADSSTASLYDKDLDLDNDNITTLTVGHSYPLDNFDAGGATSGSTISVKLIHKPSKQLIYSKSNVLLT